MALLVSNVPWAGPDADPKKALSKRLGVRPAEIRDVTLVKKSLDARRGKQRWSAVYRVDVANEARVLERRVPGARAWTDRDDGRYGLVDQAPVRRTDWPADLRPIVVGAGPAGLFAALWLAESGIPVTLLERGAPVEERVDAVNLFWRRKRELDPENNLIFGEGGSGTFSDGKIYTRRRDGELGFIFRRLVDFGADEETLKEGWAHLGTDRIRAILPPFRQRLRDLGCDVRFHAAVTGIRVEEGRAVGVELASGEVVTGAPVLMAIGHSARDSVQMMLDAGAAAAPREIAVGARIEHPQTLIDTGRYKVARGELPPASYRLAHNPEEGRKAHTFCMCPGGMVVPASNHPDRVVVNGMSFAARRAMWANSAVIVEVHPEDYGDTDPMAGFRWQDAIERRCFEVSGDYRAPAQRVSDLLAGRPSTDLPKSSFPMGLVPVDLREVLPGFVVDGMVEAIRCFDREIPGFAGEDAVLIAPETRTTSPIRFERDERGCSTTVEGLYPVGEGAGYAGGIISSALDGMRAARSIASI
ncbi:MAG: FAD-dependent monooxygenase [Alphaproteobacteria bacterium]|nr:FAD-dependent monooxygenase [Alphaproteobacteria bacterium]